ncbi:hypothetical protein [Salinispora pacifica]|uniref:hypothetical protein n=1 Tax=Salinispora pacifica TaxID=351187 RepID=UPI0004AFC8FE|nr:hypothetical protein [Salinispora pacifica]
MTVLPDQLVAGRAEDLDAVSRDIRDRVIARLPSGLTPIVPAALMWSGGTATKFDAG